MTEDQLRTAFEDAAFALYLERFAAADPAGEHTPYTREQLFWLEPDGTYGVRANNMAWWGFKVGADLVAAPLFSTRQNAKRYLQVLKTGIPFSRDVVYTDAQIDYLVDKSMGLPVGEFPKVEGGETDTTPVSAQPEPDGEVISAHLDHATVRWLKPKGDPDNAWSWPVGGEKIYLAVCTGGHEGPCAAVPA